MAVPESPLALRTTSWPSIAQAHLATPQRPGRSGRALRQWGAKAQRAAGAQHCEARSEAHRRPRSGPLPTEPLMHPLPGVFPVPIRVRCTRVRAHRRELCSTWNHALACADLKVTLADVPLARGASHRSAPRGRRGRASGWSCSGLRVALLSPIASRSPNRLEAAHQGCDARRRGLAAPRRPAGRAHRITVARLSEGRLPCP